LALRLGEYVDDVGPAEGAERSPLNVEVAGAAPGFRGLSPSVDVLAAEGGVEGSEGFPDGAVLLDIEEVAGAGAHLALGFLDEEGLGDADIGGVLLDGDGRDVAGEEWVGGLDSRNHIYYYSNINF